MYISLLGNLICSVPINFITEKKSLVIVNKSIEYENVTYYFTINTVSNFIELSRSSSTLLSTSLICMYFIFIRYFFNFLNDLIN